MEEAQRAQWQCPETTKSPALKYKVKCKLVNWKDNVSPSPSLIILEIGHLTRLHSSMHHAYATWHSLFIVIALLSLNTKLMSGLWTL